MSLDPLPETESPAPQPWRIKPVLPVTKGLGAVAVIVLVLAFGGRDPVQWAVAVALAAGLAVWTVRDLIAPVRLAADADGITVVAGYAGKRRLAWPLIEHVRVDRRDRLGIRTELLEIDCDDNLYLFSMHDLGAHPESVLATLQQLRTPPLSGPAPAR
jgi:hypothetical protein